MKKLTNTQHFGLMPQKVYSFSAIVPGDVTVEDLSSGGYWQNVASRMQPGSEIRALAEDGTFVCRLIVLFASGTDVRLKVESFTQFADVNMQDDDDYKVLNGGATGWYVKKISTGERVKGLVGLGSQAEAYQQLAEHKQMLES